MNVANERETNNIVFADNYLKELYSSLEKVDKEKIDSAIELIIDTYEKGGRIYTMGNGGSAATASHIVCDFNKGLSSNLESKFNMICLNDNIPTMMAISNDIAFDQIFVHPLKGRIKEDDIIIALSGSGNSANVINAVKYARSCGNKIIGLSGYGGGELAGLSTVSINVPINDMQKSEDAHMILLHLIARAIAEKYDVSLC